MAAHPNGGASFSGDISILGDVTAQTFTGAHSGALTGTVTGGLTLTTTVPAAADSTGTTGQIAVASGFIYVCTATNTWQRAAIATWP